MSAAVETRDARPTVTFVPRGLLCWEQVARGVFFVMQHVLPWAVSLPRSVELQAAVSRPFRPDGGVQTVGGTGAIPWDGGGGGIMKCNMASEEREREKEIRPLSVPLCGACSLRADAAPN